MDRVLILTGLSVFCLFCFIFDLVFQPYSFHVSRQMRKVQHLDLTEEEQELAEVPLPWRLLRPVWELLQAKVRLSPQVEDSLRSRLELADFDWNPIHFLAAKWFAGLGTACLGLVAVTVRWTPGSAVCWILLTISGFFLPDIILRARTLRRQERILAEFPDFIDTTRSYLSSGLSIYQTVKQIREISGPGMAGLLEKLSAELEIYDQVTALRRFAGRCGLLEVQNFVVTIEQGLTAGIPLKDIFLAQSQLMRELRKLSLKRKIKQKPTYMALVGGILFINIFILVGLPALLTIMSMRGIGE